MRNKYKIVGVCCPYLSYVHVKALLLSFPACIFICSLASQLSQITLLTSTPTIVDQNETPLLPSAHFSVPASYKFAR